MKKTILAFHSIPWVLPRWVKVSSLFVAFLAFGFSSANAQYKSVSTVVSVLEQQIEEIQPDGVKIHQSLNKISQDQKVASFKIKYYQSFLQLTKEYESVSAAVEQIDSRFQINNLPPSRAALVTAARSDLMELISE
jgi:hypothetical protein